MLKLQAKYSLGAFKLHLSKSYDAKQLRMGITGANGSGKSTLLKVLSGLRGKGTIENRHGTIKNIAMVFQRSALFEHLTVERNLQFAAKHRRSNIDLESLAQRFAISDLLAKKPASLSGGQRQRVALARAFAQNPEVLLLDEAFSAMDWQTKLTMLQQVKQLLDERSVHCLMVSHDPDELRFLCDRAIQLESGKLLFSGACEEVCNAYFSSDSARDFILEATLDQQDGSGIVAASIAGQSVFARQALVQNQQVFLKLSSNQISISLAGLEGTSMVNQLAVTLDELLELNSDMLRLRLNIAEQQLWCDISKWSAERLKLTRGQSLFANFKLV